MYTNKDLTENEKQLDELLLKIGNFTTCKDKELISQYYRLEQKNRAIVDYLFGKGKQEVSAKI